MYSHFNENAGVGDETTDDETADENLHGFSLGGDGAAGNGFGGATSNANRPGGTDRGGEGRDASEGTASDATVSDVEDTAGEGGDAPAAQRGPQPKGEGSDATVSDSDATQTDNEEAEAKPDNSGTESDKENGTDVQTGRRYDEQEWEAEAYEMRNIWKADHPQWLERSKLRWRDERLKRRRMYEMYYPQQPSYLPQPQHHRSFSAVSASKLLEPKEKKEKAPRVSKPRAPRATRANKIRVGGLKMLLEEGLITAGTNVLFILYMNQTFKGSLDASGYIVMDEQLFASPSAWSIHCKRLANPSKKADDGWKSVRYAPTGQPLEILKDQLALMQVRGDDAAKEAQRNAANAAALASGRADTNGGSGSGSVVPSQGLLQSLEPTLPNRQGEALPDAEDDDNDDDDDDNAMQIDEDEAGEDAQANLLAF